VRASSLPFAGRRNVGSSRCAISERFWLSSAALLAGGAGCSRGGRRCSAGSPTPLTRDTPYLDDFDVDPETKLVLGVALEMTRASLGLADDFANGIIAKRIVELAKAGERNPDLLCEGALKKLRGAMYSD
jgi:hypothetical protein